MQRIVQRPPRLLDAHGQSRSRFLGKLPEAIRIAGPSRFR